MPGSSESDERFFSMTKLYKLFWALFCSSPENLQHINFRTNYRCFFWSHTIPWIFQPQW